MGVRKYIRVAGDALGRPLPPGAVVHHVDENRQNNVNSNLVILENQAEHLALHRRLRILKAGGNPWTQQICCTCKTLKMLDEFGLQTSSNYNMERLGCCKQCVADRARTHTNRKLGRDPNWCETPEEKSARGRRAALKRWRSTSADVHFCL